MLIRALFTHSYQHLDIGMSRSYDSYTEYPAWREFLEQFPSSKAYDARMNSLVQWHFANKENPGTVPLHSSIEEYIKAHHIVDEEGKFQYCSSTLRTWISVFKKWYEISGEYPTEFKQVCTRLENNQFKDWGKREVV